MRAKRYIMTNQKQTPKTSKSQKSQKPQKSTKTQKSQKVQKTSKTPKTPNKKKAKEELSFKEKSTKAPIEKTKKTQKGSAGSANAGRSAKAKRDTRAQNGESSRRTHKERLASNSPAKISERQEYRKNTRTKKRSRSPLKVMMLGGLQEIGKNLTVLEYEDHIIVIDCGLAFPDDDMPGVDLVIADISYLEANAHKIHALFLTHGHEDHIGGIPFFLRSINVPIYGTSLTLGILARKLEEYSLPQHPDLRPVVAGDVIDAGVFHAEFIHVNHSIADACAIAVKTPVGTVFHTGDFKLDVSPIDGKIMDLTRIGEIGNEGVLLMLGESTNAERAGYTPSEKNVGKSLEAIFSNNKTKRIVIATFSSNVHRVQQIIDASVRHGRKVAVIGRSMINVVGAALELGYIEAPDGAIIDIKEIKKYNNENLTLITTGSQGEPMSALYRMAFNEHDKVRLGADDLVVLSSSPIPGNEKLISKIVNALVLNGISVVNDSSADVHVSGHACSEELKLMLALVRPKFFMPIHGEVKHLYAHKAIAEFMGIPATNIFVGENGRVLELDGEGARFNGSVPAGKLLIDGSGIGDVGNIVLRDRKVLSQDGIIIVAATIDMVAGMLVCGPDIVSRGFVYVRESEELMDEIKRVAEKSIEKSLKNGVRDWAEIKTSLKDALGSALYSRTKRKPMVLPVLLGF